MNQSDIAALNEIKMLSIDMISRAGSGFPGSCLSAAPIIFTLYERHLNFQKNQPNWMNRDRFILSSGHMSAVLYATLHLFGFNITKEDLMNYRTLGSNTPGFPELGVTPGIESTTGSSGEGISMSVGVALGERYLRNLLKQEDERLNIIDYYTYCLCNDLELMKGSVNESLSFAGTQNLNHFILLCDVTSQSEDGNVNLVFTEDIMKKYQAMGFYVDYLKDGSNIRDIDKSISSAKRSGKPSILLFKNILGKDSFNENKSIVYNKPLSVDDSANLRKKWNLFLPPFEISKDSLIYIQKYIANRTEKKYEKWNNLYNRAKSDANPKAMEIINALENKEVIIDFDSINYKINDNYRENLRETNLKILNIIGGKTNLFLGGSAESSIACQTYLNNTSEQTNKNPLGKNIRFGFRDQAMGFILNGLALSGLKVFGSTKLVNSDYLKPAIRFSALMNLPVTYIFTHDTVSVGEDGPVFEAVEQLSMLRTTPNLITYRPADIMEVMGSWEMILKTNMPSALVITHQDAQHLPGSNSKEVSKGAYIIKSEKQRLDGIIISCGSELIYALQIAYDLEKQGLDIRVVSMPSMELFLSSGKEYEMNLLPEETKKIVLEAGSPIIWNRFASCQEYIIGINDYGFSGHHNEVLKKMELDYDNLKMRIERILR